MDELYVYINEMSIEGQFCDDICGAATRLLRLVEQLKNVFKGQVSIFYSDSLMDRNACWKNPYTSLKDIKKVNKDLWYKFLNLRDRAREVESVVAEQYWVNKKDVSTSSLADVYRKIKEGLPVYVISFSPSISFPNKSIRITSGKDFVDVCNITIEDDIVDNISKINVSKYDNKSLVPPLDCQTILADDKLFEKTNLPTQKGRKVYKRIGYDEYWYVDGLHNDGKAHLEVFNSNNNTFKGECRIDDINGLTLNKNKKKASRKMYLG